MRKILVLQCFWLSILLLGCGEEPPSVIVNNNNNSGEGNEIVESVGLDESIDDNNLEEKYDELMAQYEKLAKQYEQLNDKILETQKESSEIVQSEIVVEEEITEVEKVVSIEKINLLDLVYITKDNDICDYTDTNLVDNLGNVYTSGIGFEYMGRIEYVLNSKYTALEGEIVISDRHKNSDITGQFCVYDENGRELCTVVNVTRGMEPTQIKADVSGVHRIVVNYTTSDQSSLFPYIYLVNGCLY